MPNTLYCTIVTPESMALDARADFVALPLYDGEMGIAPDHSPLIGRLGYGELRLRSGSQVTRYYVDGGFVQVADNEVAIMTTRVVPAGDVDAEAAKRQLDDAVERVASTKESREIRDRLTAQARGQLRVARRGKP
jgi:F-type H+-transporting ATPase subunit epsilon